MRDGRFECLISKRGISFGHSTVTYLELDSVHAPSDPPQFFSLPDLERLLIRGDDMEHLSIPNEILGIVTVTLPCLSVPH